MKRNSVRALVVVCLVAQAATESGEPQIQDKGAFLRIRRQSAVALGRTQRSYAPCHTAPKECVFPFIYKDAKYKSCTKKSFDQLWCATAVDSVNHYIGGSWVKCGNVCLTRTVAATCKPPPETCVFPFLYKDKLFEKCTYSDSGEPWCATEVDSRGFYTGLWKICDNVCDDNASCQPPPAACVFPFSYRGVLYTTCTKKSYDHSWCATKVDSAGSYVPGHWTVCQKMCDTSTEEDFDDNAVEIIKPSNKIIPGLLNKPECGPDEFQCPSSVQCIPAQCVCNKEVDCQEGGDELGC